MSSTDSNPLAYSIPAQELRLENAVANSRFIATINPVGSIDEARAFIAEIRKEFADASHNVPAYIIGGGNTVTEYCSDDGEPSGTALLASQPWQSCAVPGWAMLYWWSLDIMAGLCWEKVD